MNRNPTLRRSGGTALLVMLLCGATACPPEVASPPVIASIEMSPKLLNGWFSMPWPNDIRRSDAGMLDWTALPGITTDLFTEPLPQIPLLPEIMAKAQPSVSQFGRNTAVYFRSTVALDPSSLPTPAAATGPESAVQLIDLETGERAPIVVVGQERQDRFRPSHLLTLLPYPGHPLRSDARYAAVVFDDVESAGHIPLEPAELIRQLGREFDSSMPMTAAQHAALGSQLADVAAAVTEHTSHDPGEIVAFSVYRTQNTHREWDGIVAAANAAPTPSISVAGVDACAPSVRDGGASMAIVHGSVPLPMWQAGDFPYLLEGGGIVVPASGRAVLQGTRSTPVQLLVPCSAPPPAGWPVLTFMDGTGGDEDIATTRAPVRRSGVVYGQISPLYGNGIAGAAELLSVFGYTDPAAQKELVFYNLLNPAAIRTNPLQQASDHLVFTRALAQFAMSGAEFGQPGTVRADASKVVIAGHSQGAQTLALVAGADPTIDGVISSAGSGGQYHSISHSPKRLSAIGLVTNGADRMDELNPLIQMVQTVFEIADGANYPTTQHFLNLSAYSDTCTTVETGTHYAMAQRLDTFAAAPEISYGEPSLDRRVASLPVTANSGGATRVQILLPGGHFGYLNNVDRLTQFLTQVHAGSAPVVHADQFVGSVSNCPGTRYDDPPRLFAI